ncbi:MAG TPA: hypothetical protein VKF42_03700 [Chitinivibrionales bacterium]|jgi:hypothetical protein|nr:hypothetical protein [Chitinivibrionales bacterium]
MIKLENSDLTVEIIDPAGDRHLLGSRYCTGGYIFQISDNRKGNLLSGPTFGSGSYCAFDGQGAPEVFLTALNEDKAKVGEAVVVLGVGVVTRTSPVVPFHARDNPVVEEFAPWDVDRRAGKIVMRTRQVFDKWDISIVRTVVLRGRTVVSATMLSNSGKAAFPLRWFPHPFFPLSGDRAACRFDFPVFIPDNQGYFLNSQGVVELKQEYDWAKGLYQPLVVENPVPFSAEQLHPLVGRVSVLCDYVPSFLPVWANDRTFSFEPYLEKLVNSGQEISWRVEYTF